MENLNLLTYEQIYDEYNQICSDYNDDLITLNQYDNKMDILSEELIDFLSNKYPELINNIDYYKWKDLLDYIIETYDEEDFIHTLIIEEVNDPIKLFNIDITDYIDDYYKSKQK